MGLTGAVVGEHRLDFASPPDDVSSVHDFLADVWTSEPAISVEDRMALELAIIELASNVIEHATAGVPLTCSLTLAVASDGLEARITDDGRPAAVDVAGATLPDEFAESGRGLALVQMVVDELRYDRHGDENRWTVRKATRAA
ncbi:ATP-binding protein [Curtobacterium sp. MCJR17_055]|uniref:ATP-binding protein n=1 Tax=unclassified Curtobacterium TaxID=257496 RepID=UPI000D9063BF|nr:MULTISPECIES: ATP-binding protein [unclassified Curtobacterium]PYY33058.1 ATP-binding protein [Curtobacterium sp. MCBD17_029]PYY43267.1 ATP-binding protein [Curtobacterium sp. MCPF17_046]PYY50861.1 ATP-binding protein [Curtobacterium sp. MCBD17_023]PYY53886.1 ATP-binding protein [Curtobacterium sp. MCJR17_055]PYY59226.1 ATP-binding protein [Curtobacterium sp. MCPF17_015]